MPRKFDESPKKEVAVCSQIISMDAKRFFQAMEISIKKISQDALVRNPKRWML